MLASNVVRERTFRVYSSQVLIAGGGPTGLWLACELRRYGIDVTILEQRSSRTGESRAGGLHARSLEILGSRGLADRFVAAGRRVPFAHFAGLWLEMGRLDTAYPYVLGLVQSRIEALLEDHLLELGTKVRWGAGIAEVVPFADHVEVTTATGERFTAGYLVGCDGGRSTVRRRLGIPFDGTDATVSSMLADVRLAEPPGPIFQRRTPLGDFSVLQLEAGHHRLMLNHYEPATTTAPPDLAEFRAAFTALAGTDFGLHSPQWISRYHDAARLAARYRDGRVLLAGDAAHIHWPAGGQGLNTGLQDATNLGWKLALTVNGHAPAPTAPTLVNTPPVAPPTAPSPADLTTRTAAELNALATGAPAAAPTEGLALLDTYEAERRPVAARVLANTRAQTALCRPGPHTDALRATVADLLTIPEANDRLAAMVAGLDQADRAPTTPLAPGRGTLTAPPETLTTASPWADRVEARPDTCERLVRPDGHIAWSGGPGLHEALTTWFGPPTAR
ncbi:FAD-dependent monooxygenase [Dactylosporangium vinaceum]|nr:FAD-dependent monooxygenase [Dactylosporangium vinaceum]